MSSSRSGRTYDPSAWAAERRSAVERANKLREERRTQSVESADFSFTPQLVARHPSGGDAGSDHQGPLPAHRGGVAAAPMGYHPHQLGGGVGAPPSEMDQLHALGDAKFGRPVESLDRLASDSLDHFYAAEGARLQGKENARMDPNYGSLGGRGGSHVFEASSLVSPSNDSLGQELRRQGSSSHGRGYRPSSGGEGIVPGPGPTGASPYSSRYAQELYQEGVAAPPSGYQGSTEDRRNQGRPDLFAQAFPDQVPPGQPTIDAHDTFSTSLRSPEHPRGRGRGRRSRQREEAPEWNPDTNVNYPPGGEDPAVGGGPEVSGSTTAISGLDGQRRGRGRGRGRGKEGLSQGPTPPAQPDRPAWVGVGNPAEAQQEPAWATFDEDGQNGAEIQHSGAGGGPPRRQSSLSNLKARMKSREASRGSNVRHSRSADSQGNQREARPGGFGWRAQTSPDVPQPDPFAAPSRPSRPAPKAPPEPDPPAAEERRRMLQQHQQQPKAAYRGMYKPPQAGAVRAEPPTQPPPRRPPMPHPDDSQKSEDAPVGGGTGAGGGGDYFSQLMEKALAQGAFPDGQIPASAMDAPSQKLDLVECSTCGRRMTSKALASHAKACIKVFQSKRKRFDSTKARVEGTEAAKFVKDARRKHRLGGGKQRQEQAPSAKNAKWRAQSEQFREAMRAARQVKIAEKTGAPMPPPSISSGPDPSLVPCPHCGRRFNETAAERHIPRCKDIKAKPTTLKRGTRVPLGSSARQASDKRSSTGSGFRR